MVNKKNVIKKGRQVMKKILVIGLMMALTICLFADLQIKDNNGPKPVTEQNPVAQKNARTEISPAPAYEFVVNPVVVKANDFYDYQFGSYDGIPIQAQPNGDGIYFTYMHKVSPNGRRAQNFAYLTANGEVVHEGGITSETVSEGFGTLGIDPVTNNPFFAWHTVPAGAADPDVHVAADNYSLMSIPNTLLPAKKIIDNNAGNAEHECFIWPVVYIGPSPNAGQRRLHVFSSNSGTRPTSDANPSSNVLYAYADFTSDTFDEGDLESMEWHYAKFPYFEAIHTSETWARSFGSYSVNNNMVVLGSFVSADDGIDNNLDPNNPYPPHDVFFLVNDNYGEGDFELYTFLTDRDIPSPTNQDGQVYPAGYHNFKISNSSSNHKNLALDNYGRIHFGGNYSATFNDDSGDDDSRYYWPVTMYTKDLRFDHNTGELVITDVQPKGEFPNDGLLTIPWDFNEDGTPDSYTVQSGVGYWDYQHVQFPVTYYETEEQFHYNYYRSTHASPSGWMALIWNDSYNAYRYHKNDDQDYAAFANAPEVFMSLSKDNGVNWSEPIIMNAVPGDEHYEPAFNGMIPTWFYVDPVITELDNDWGEISLMFMNDNSFGSSVQSHGANTGGNIMYAAMKVKFSDITVGTNENVVVSKPSMLKQNYPNPFNPTTKISFTLNKGEKANLSIYNVKGQLVKTLVDGYANAGSHEVVWNGLDNNNSHVGSGVYFYKLSTSSSSEIKKMVLMK